MAILLATGALGGVTSVAVGARANLRIVLEAVYVSYSIAGVGTLTITQDDSTVLFNLDVFNSGLIPFPSRVVTAIGQGCTVALTGIAATVGKVVVIFGATSY